MALLGSLGWTSPSHGAAVVATAPGGLYVGYYQPGLQEDLPGDPSAVLPGAFVMTLPAGDTAFQGAMFFNVASRHGSHASAVRGLKAGTALSGSWSGELDGDSRSGPWQGSYDKDLRAYHGLYGNAGGKQRKTADDCISGYTAPHGIWEMFPLEHGQPGDFHLGAIHGKLRWTSMPDMAMTLVYFVDLAVAEAGIDNPIACQAVLQGGPNSFDLREAALVAGRGYLAVAMVRNRAGRRIAFASSRFTAA